MVSAKDKYEKTTRRVNELWQTDFTHMKVQGWHWYYLATVLDDYSRYILAWKLSKTMGAQDVQDTLELALAKTDLEQIKIRHRPRLLSDNGPCYLSGELKKFSRSSSGRAGCHSGACSGCVTCAGSAWTLGKHPV